MYTWTLGEYADSSEERLFPRLFSEAIRTALADMPVVCILGQRQSGETTLAQQLTAKWEFIGLDEQPLRQTAGRDPDGFINGLPDHVTIDEVLRVPELLPVIKLSVAQDRRPDRFLLTGSAIKVSSSINAKDGQGLARLARRCGKQFQRGIVFYAGASTLPMPDKRMLTVPLSELWER